MGVRVSPMSPHVEILHEINRHFFPKKYYFGETECFDFIEKTKCYS